MLKPAITLLFILLLPGNFRSATAQGSLTPPEPSNDLPGRVFISPDISLILGNLTSIELSPLIGYHLSPRLIVGAGGKYQFYQEKSYISSQLDIKTTIYGYRLFSRMIIIRDINEVIPLNIPLGLFGHVEFESLSLEEKYFRFGHSGSDSRYWLNSVLAGPGISQRTGYRTWFNILVLWDLTASASSPFAYPTLKFGLQIYF